MIYDTYNDIVKQIEIVQIAINNYNDQLEYLKQLSKVYGPTEDIKGIDYSSDPVQSSGQIDFIRYVEESRKIENHLLLHQRRLEHLKYCKSDIETILVLLDGKEYKVFYKKYVEGKTTQVIADEMGVGLRHAQRILRKIKKDMKMSY